MSKLTTHDKNNKNHDFFNLVMPRFRTYPMEIMQKVRKASMLKMFTATLSNIPEK